MVQIFSVVVVVEDVEESGGVDVESAIVPASVLPRRAADCGETLSFSQDFVVDLVSFPETEDRTLVAL